MRLFIAISIDPAIQAVLAAFAGTIKAKTGNSVRWVKPENLHLTVKFLGEVDQTRLSALQEQIQVAAGSFAPFDFSLTGCGVFPGWIQPRILWAGIQPHEIITRLAASLESSLETLGFPPEQRPFSPHLTFGRVNDWITPEKSRVLKSEMETAGNKSFGSVHADHLTLYRSDLRPEGPNYTELARSTFSPSR